MNRLLATPFSMLITIFAYTELANAATTVTGTVGTTTWDSRGESVPHRRRGGGPGGRYAHDRAGRGCGVRSAGLRRRVAGRPLAADLRSVGGDRHRFRFDPLSAGSEPVLALRGIRRFRYEHASLRADQRHRRIRERREVIGQRAGRFQPHDDRAEHVVLRRRGNHGGRTGGRHVRYLRVAAERVGGGAMRASIPIPARPSRSPGARYRRTSTPWSCGPVRA